VIKRIDFANVFASNHIVIEDPTHLIRRNFVQFSKVYLLADQAANQHIYYNMYQISLSRRNFN
ncbi:hypothetical protein, partial [Limosilactobacillus balticus]|uniref:hypothetical protein n=1 Tax=Limosilactobacillus balticus TaxID=2759747 RepID=UPI001C71A234